jgi:putative hemolysin
MRGTTGDVFTLRRDLPLPLAAPLDRLLGLRTLESAYRDLPPTPDPVSFLDRCLDLLEVRIEVRADDLSKIPSTGPTVLVSNHPYGGIEGMALALLLLRTVRPDVRIMANYFLGRIPELRELFFLVDPFETRDSARRNMTALRQAVQWVRNGRLLVVFPAGEVAHLNLRRRLVIDPPWFSAVGRIIRRTGAAAVPVFFDGHNGPLFQLAGLIHRRLRTALLPRELLARRGQTLSARIGGPIPFRQLQDLDDRAMTAHLRHRTEILAERSQGTEVTPRAPVQPRQTPAAAAPLIDPVSEDLMEGEVTGLPADQLLVNEPDQQVWVAESAQIPNLLREIGRLRELTFREVGEGTGRELDLDAFDETYLHLFIWNSSRREVVGAYRLGRCDEILRRDGIAGLYTSSLFRFAPRIFEQMGPALEMGRSFVRPEYQKSFSGLVSLWRGIGRYVIRHPEYAVLFGPVSISADYRSASQQLIAAFLKQNNFAHRWSRWVRPRTPFRPAGRRGLRFGPCELCDLDDVSTFISEIETDRKGVPVLLKQYLKLGGRLLGFNVDPDFSNVLDVLIMVDLRQTDVRVLGRYLGREDAAAFLAHHGVREAEPVGAGT